MRSLLRAALGSAVFFVLAPGTVVGLVPWLISGWSLHEPFPFWIAAQILGALMIAAGIGALVHAFVRFTQARGTPAPVAPTEHLVVSGANRFVRNPMYVACIAALLGQALLFASVWIAVYTLVAWIGVATFVRLYEEPTLARRFGGEYAAYRAAVPAWIPRLTPYTAERSTA